MRILFGQPVYFVEQKLSLKQIEERLRAAGHKVGTLYELRPDRSTIGGGSSISALFHPVAR
jgi:hypothetical protein